MLNESLNIVKEDFQKLDSHVTRDSVQKIRELAKNKFIPSLDLFQKMLDDDRSDWTIKGLNAIAYFDLEESVVSKIRDLLLNSKYPSVKMTASSILGLKSKWPDAALRKCLMTEEDRDVRISATRAILELAKVNFRAVDLEIDRMKSGEIEPEFSEIERITQADSDGLYKDLT
jgi:hypothetical protein